ncbi:TraR/DksA family transcriptional regulator [Paracoccus sp. (in: a-proteobacteria)]|uniref:TraR/DksA family transcriptional regulator n=1 Tax=Paracoccus sp. TaxID=267 RepID=UPI0035AEE1E5
MDERDFDRAEAIAAAERDSAAARASRAVNTAGQSDCEDCGAGLSPARILAAPFATRCIACQTAFERRKKAYAL